MTRKKMLENMKSEQEENLKQLTKCLNKIRSIIKKNNIDAAGDFQRDKRI